MNDHVFHEIIQPSNHDRLFDFGIIVVNSIQYYLPFFGVRFIFVRFQYDCTESQQYSTSSTILVYAEVHTLM